MKTSPYVRNAGSSWGRLWLMAWLGIAASLVGWSLCLPSNAPRQVASASPATDVELTHVSLHPSPARLTHTFQAIEELRVGMRVVADNPETDTPEQTAVDPATWRLVKLYAEERWPDGTLDTIHIETLQPPLWLELFEVKVGARVPPPLDLVEMGLPEDLETTVVNIEPCPELQAGPGRLVLTTVDHLNNDVWELSAENAAGQREELRPTGSHKFYSETRRNWVSTKEIHDNEVIRGRAGPLTIVAKEELPGTQRVYNLTVEGEHVYYVSELGLLAHNNCPNAQNRAMDFSSELSDPVDVARARLRNSIGLGRGDADEAHHLIPLGLTDHEVVKRAAKAGFDFNGKTNGMALSFDQHRGVNIFHHNRYNAAVEKKLNRLIDANPNMTNVQAAAALQSYAEQLRSGISRSTKRLR